MVKVTYTSNLSTARKANSSFLFMPRVFIFSTTIAYRCKFAAMISEYSYDLGVKGQCQIYSKCVLRLLTLAHLLQMAEGVHI